MRGCCPAAVCSTPNRWWQCRHSPSRWVATTTGGTSTAVWAARRWSRKAAPSPDNTSQPTTGQGISGGVSAGVPVVVPPAGAGGEACGAARRRVRARRAPPTVSAALGRPVACATGAAAAGWGRSRHRAVCARSAACPAAERASEKILWQRGQPPRRSPASTTASTSVDTCASLTCIRVPGQPSPSAADWGQTATGQVVSAETPSGPGECHEDRGWRGEVGGERECAVPVALEEVGEESLGEVELSVSDDRPLSDASTSRRTEGGPEAAAPPPAATPRRRDRRGYRPPPLGACAPASRVLIWRGRHQ